MRAYTSPMRKAPVLIITLAVGIGIGIFTDRALVKLHEPQSRHVETESSQVVETVINGQKVVVLTDDSRSLHADSK